MNALLQKDAQETVDIVLKHWESSYFSCLNIDDTTSQTGQESGNPKWKYYTKPLPSTDPNTALFRAVWSEPSKLEPFPHATVSVDFKYTQDGTLEYKFESLNLYHSLKLSRISTVSNARFLSELENLSAPPPTLHSRYDVKQQQEKIDDAMDHIQLSKLKYESIKDTTLGVPSKRIPEIIASKLRVSEAIKQGKLLRTRKQQEPIIESIDNFDYEDGLPYRYSANELLTRHHLYSEENKPIMGNVLSNANLCLDELLKKRNVVLEKVQTCQEAKLAFEAIVPKPLEIQMSESSISTTEFDNSAGTPGASIETPIKSDIVNSAENSVQAVSVTNETVNVESQVESVPSTTESVLSSDESVASFSNKNEELRESSAKDTLGIVEIRASTSSFSPRSAENESEKRVSTTSFAPSTADSFGGKVALEENEREGQGSAEQPNIQSESLEEK